MIAGMKDTDWLRLNPQHPGTHIKVGCLDACDDYPGMTVEAAAAKLGVSRVTLSRIVNGHRPVTVELAMKLEAIGWGVADNWLAYQTRWDLAQARKRLKPAPGEGPRPSCARSNWPKRRRLRRKRRDRRSSCAGPRRFGRTLRRGKKTLACRNAPHYKK